MLRPVHIGGYGVGDWKSQYGVSDAGASSAGVYGSPASTWDIARAQEETQRLQAPPADAHHGGVPLASYAPPALHGSPPAHRNFGAASTRGDAQASRSSGWFKLLVLTCVLPVALAGMGFMGMMVLATFGGNAPGALDTAHYERLSEDARQLSTQPASRLYATWLRQTSPAWSTLDSRQQSAVAAAWIRYTRNPGSFDRLVPEQKTYLFAAFASYLQALSMEGDAQATRDLALLKSR